MLVRLLPAAEAEARDAVSWYEQQRPGLGMEFFAELDSTLFDLGQRPESFERWPENERYRKTRLARFPYTLFFTVGDEVEVVAVAHSKRRPGYWLSRP